jgi:DNA-binding NarL/FixJ family response regulator
MGRRRAARHHGGMKRIFIVEDSRMLRERLEKLLNALPDTLLLGHAQSADAATAAILATRPDIVLLDLCLENSSGFDVLRRVHEVEPGIDFYMLTNFASEPYRRHAERLGARGFFDKSNEFERIRDAVAAHQGAIA